MTRERLLDELQELFRDAFEDPQLELDEDLSPDDVEGWDSLMQIKLLEAVKEEYGISFTLDEMIEIKNVRDLMDCILGKLE